MKRRVNKVYVVGGFAFVQHPHVYGMWLRCDMSVAKVQCPFCDAPVGVPCQNTTSKNMWRGRYAASTHYVRRHAARKLPQPATVVETVLTIRESPPAAPAPRRVPRRG